MNQGPPIATTAGAACCAASTRSLAMPICGSGRLRPGVDLAERMHAGIPGSRVELFRGGHMFFLFAERQRFLDQAGRFLAE